MSDDKQLAQDIRTAADALAMAMTRAGQAGLTVSVKLSTCGAVGTPSGPRIESWYPPTVIVSRNEFIMASP